MKAPLGEHIRRLEERLESVRAEMMRHEFEQETRNRLEAEIRLLNLAIGHYVAAITLERRLIPSDNRRVP